MKSLYNILTCIALAVLFTSCGTLSYDGGTASTLDREKASIVLPPFENATNDEFASVAMTEITASALMAKGVMLYQSEDIINRLGEPEAPLPEGTYRDIATEVGAEYVLIGTVHEYRYKTDLDGDPAVGASYRLIDVSDGRTVWQGTSSNVGFFNASLTTAGQKVAQDLVSRMPLE